MLLTPADLSRYSSKRRAVSRHNNPEYRLDLFHKMFGSSKCVFSSFLYSIISTFLCSSSTLLTIFGGRVSDLESILVDERLPEGWESRIRKPFGLTIASFQPTVLRVEFGIDESKFAAEARSTAAAESGEPNPTA